MHRSRLLLGCESALAVTLLCACAGGQLERNVYEGARQHNESYKSTPLENPRGALPPYDQYEKERQEGGSK